MLSLILGLCLNTLRCFLLHEGLSKKKRSYPEGSCDAKLPMYILFRLRYYKHGSRPHSAALDSVEKKSCLFFRCLCGFRSEK